MWNLQLQTRSIRLFPLNFNIEYWILKFCRECPTHFYGSILTKKIWLYFNKILEYYEEHPTHYDQFSIWAIGEDFLKACQDCG